MKAALKRIKTLARTTAPYLLIELVLPGGTVLSILYWLSRRTQDKTQTIAATDDKPAIFADLIYALRRLLRIESAERPLLR